MTTTGETHVDCEPKAGICCPNCNSDCVSALGISDDSSRHYLCNGCGNFWHAPICEDKQ